jgi:dihydroorotate dehydrogenase (NAD+) catalytic subunit
MVASGTFGYAEEFKNYVRLKKLGAIVTKTITLNPRKGNPMPRTCETAAGMLNAIGLENPGLDSFIKEKMPILKNLGAPIIVSIASEVDQAEFTTLIRRLDTIKEIAAFELNISCPNLKSKKLISQDPKATFAAADSVRKITNKTIIIKLSPNVTDITEIAKAAEDAGSDAVSLVNTFTGISIDIGLRKSKLANITGGLSGPAIKPIALRMVWETAKAVRIPVIGIGGIMTANDALEFIIAGATAVQIGTANFINPGATENIIDGLTKYLKDNKIEHIKNLVGSLKQ